MALGVEKAATLNWGLRPSVPQSIKTPKNKHKSADYRLFSHPDSRFGGGEESNSLPHVQKKTITLPTGHARALLGGHAALQAHE